MKNWHTEKRETTEEESKWMCVYATYACILNKNKAKNMSKQGDMMLKGYRQNIF